MTLAVIGAGFGRTGTDSMRVALDTLGFGPCHHMRSLREDPEQKRLWRALVKNRAKGAAPDWPRLFAGYGSCLDWPSVYYWRELAVAYPEAKILLTTRSPESWLASMQKTIFQVIAKGNDPDSVGETLILQDTFGGRIGEPDHVLAVYQRHLEEVQASIPRKRLLVYQLGDGWEPLCRFLEVPLPETPFPRRNAPDQFHASREARRGD